MTEFLVLKNELNESNKFANQHTQLVFEIEEAASRAVRIVCEVVGGSKISNLRATRDHEMGRCCQ